MTNFVVMDRDQHTRDYTVLSNRILRDTSISYHARYLMAWLLSYNPKEDFKYTLEMIARRVKMPLSRVRTSVQELQDAGYIRLERTRNGARYGNYIWYISENPKKTTETKPAQERDIPVTAEITSIEQFNFDNQAEVISASEYNFNRIWQEYPPHRRGDLKEAKKAFNQIPNVNDIIEDIIDGLHEMQGKNDWLKEEGRWIPSLKKFLANRIWEEGLNNPTSAAAFKDKMMEAYNNATV